MKIVVVGTSNSVMGNKGYIEALTLEHDVTQLSSGRVPFYASLKSLINNRELIENSDLLIIDHYINDVNFYGQYLGDDYRQHLKLFYAYLSTLNVNIINLMFPMKNISNQPAVDIYVQTKWLCQEYNISILDLNELNIPSHFYRDSIHLTHDVSYALGVSLNLSLLKEHFTPVKNGKIIDFPFYSLSADDLTYSGNQVSTFKNSLVNVRYLNLKKTLTINNPDHHRLIAIGFVKNKNIDGESGFVLNGEEVALHGTGYFLETIEHHIDRDITLSPLLGEKEVPNMMHRGTSKGVFTYCYLSDLIFMDSHTDTKVTSADREVYHLDINGFIPLADRLTQTEENQSFHFDFSPKTVDKLRDISLSLGKRDLVVARDLMKLASIGRPNGTLIKRKLAEFETAIISSK